MEANNVSQGILTPPLPPLSRSVPKDNNVDPKKLKRTAASREYSQRYRLKQLQHTAKLEAELRALQANIAITIPRIKYADSQNALLRAENGSVKHKLSATTVDLVLKEAQYEELLKERDALKQLSLYKTPGEEITHGQLPPQFLMNMPVEQPNFDQFMDAAMVVSNMLNQNSANLQHGSSHVFSENGSNNGNDEEDDDNLMLTEKHRGVGIMEGKNKDVNLPEVASPTPPLWSGNLNTDASRTYFMSSSALPPLPTSFQARPKPHIMSHAGAAAASSGGNKTGLPSPYPLVMNMMGQNNSITEHNPFSESIQYSSGSAGDGAQVQWGQKVDPDIDPRKLRRIASNRLSAQKSRMKKLQHVADLEKQAEALEAQIAILRPQVENFRAQKHFLELEQQSLNGQIAACASREQHLDAQIEIKKAEAIRVGSQLGLAMQQQKLQTQAESVWQSVCPVRYGAEQTMYFNSNQADVGDTTEEIMRLNQLSLNQQHLGNPGKMIPTPGWKPEQGSPTNMGFSFNRSDQAPSFNLNKSEPGPGFSFNKSESGPSFSLKHSEPAGPSFIQPITHQLGYEGMNPSVVGELEQMLNVDPSNQDSCSDFCGLK